MWESDSTLLLTDWKHSGKPAWRGGSSGSGVAVGHGWNGTELQVALQLQASVWV